MYVYSSDTRRHAEDYYFLEKQIVLSHTKKAILTFRRLRAEGGNKTTDPIGVYSYNKAEQAVEMCIRDSRMVQWKTKYRHQLSH